MADKEILILDKPPSSGHVNEVLAEIEDVMTPQIAKSLYCFYS